MFQANNWLAKVKEWEQDLLSGEHQFGWTCTIGRFSDLLHWQNIQSFAGTQKQAEQTAVLFQAQVEQI